MGTYPVSPPFAYTAIPDFVFDQVLTFTVMNTLQDNIDNIGSALEIEHYFDGEDGTHRRIFEKGNTILNPTARQGNLFWWDGGAATDYDTPGVDTDQALNYNPANFNPEDWTDGIGRGPLWSKGLAGAPGFAADLSEAIPISAARTINLSGQLAIAGYVAGNMYIDVVCYDAANLFLGVIAQTVLNATTVDSIFDASGTTPANTTYVRIRKWYDATAEATSYTIRKLQLTNTADARSYNDDSHVNSYVSIHYESDAGQSFAQFSTTIVNFEDKVYDDPNTDRVTVGANWKFTAERFMRLRISSLILFQQSSAWGSSVGARYEIWKTPAGGVAARYKLIDLFEPQVNPLINYAPLLKGTAQITLNNGDAWDIRLVVVGNLTPSPQSLNVEPDFVWVDCEEI
jgi:hypothetical protein